MYWKRSIDHRSKRRVVEYLAADIGVSVERFLEVVAARKRYRAAKAERRRRRQRFLALNPKAKSRPREGVVFAGEGEFHALLREAGMSIKDYAQLAGYADFTVRGWNGHPMYHEPVLLLTHIIWARNMAAFLAERGWNAEDFKPKGLPRTTDGRYARTSEQGEAIRASVQPATILCPVHGNQVALGGECPKC